MSWISMAAYSRLRGCSLNAVKKAIKSDRLKNSIRKNGKGKVEVNPEAANLEWEINTDKSKQLNVKNRQAEFRPHIKDMPGLEISTADLQTKEFRQLQEEYNAKLAKLKYEREAGLYVPVESVKAEWFKIVTDTKTKILGLPSKAKANIPHLTNADVQILDRLCREALEELAHGGN